VARRLPALVVALLLIPIARVPAQSRSFDLLTARVGDIQAAVAAGALTSERLVMLCLARIDAYDQKGPRLNAVLQINPRALETARALDAERRRSSVRSPLHGIPIAVNDNIDVARDNPLSSVTGLPAIVLPAGLTRGGLPIAIEMPGRPSGEPALIGVGSAYERATHARVAPPTTPHLPGETFVY
jgi:Asp-tRNA(Asn)/Glu-tRNA(Gln) amidotransferase A subunit family amidase